MSTTKVDKRERNALMSPKQKRRKIMIKNSNPADLERESGVENPSMQEERIIFSKRLLKPHYISLQHSSYKRKEVELESNALEYSLAKIIKENHSNSIDQLLLIDNLLFSVSQRQVNLYDNEHFGNHLDLLVHYLLPEEYRKILAFDCVCCEEDILFAVGTDSGHVVLISTTYSTVLHVIQVEGIERLRFASKERLVVQCGQDRMLLTWDGGEMLVKRASAETLNEVDGILNESAKQLNHQKVALRIENSTPIPQICLIQKQSDKLFGTICDRKLTGKEITSSTLSDDLNFVHVGTSDGYLMRLDIN